MMNLQNSGKSFGRWCGLGFMAAFLLAGWLRVEQLGVKPLHHDESVNGWFMLSLANDGQYRYNPDNYHGPSLYYLTLLPLRLIGESEAALRSVPVIFGLLGIGFLWLLRRRLGPAGTVAAALLMASSTGLVYYSRDFIHEMIFGCLSLGVVAGAVRYYAERRYRWMVMGSASLALLFATKETAIVTTIVLVLAVLSARVWTLIRGRVFPPPFSADIRHGGWFDHTVGALMIFIFINLILYSSLFTNGAGISDALRSPWRWTLRSESEHVKGFWYYLELLLKLELPLLVGAIGGGILIIWRGTRFWLFVGAWALGLFLAYSLIGYKTPWLIVNMLMPMTLLAGHAIQRLFELASTRLMRLIITLPLLAGLGYNVWFTRDFNLVHFDDNLNQRGMISDLGRIGNLELSPNEGLGYVYAQTDRDFLNLVTLIRSEANQVGEGTTIYIAAPEYWPLPWYLRQFKVDFTGKLPDFDQSGDPLIEHRMIIVSSDQIHKFSEASSFRVSPTSFSMRPGVSLVLLVRKTENIKESELR